MACNVSGIVVVETVAVVVEVVDTAVETDGPVAAELADAIFSVAVAKNMVA